MEAIAIFGIACNVMQTISFAHEAVKVARDMRHGGSMDSILEYNTSHLNTCILNLKQQLENGAQPITQDCRTLLDIASGSLTTGTAISTELAKIRELSQKSSVHAAMAWFKTITVVKRRLKDLDETMRARQRILETQLLTRICKTTDAAIIMNQEGFDNLDHSMQRFVAALSRGQTALQNLIAEESISIKAHVTGETEKLRQGIKEDISTRSRKFDDTISSAVEAAQKFQAERQEGERLLKSLNYPGKDSRRDQIENAHHQTFEWIFSSITDESTDVSLSDANNLGQDDSSDDETDSSSQATDFSTYSDDVEYSTLQWDDFVEWLRSQDHRPYWVSGKAGSGKSTLMRFLAEDSRTIDILHAKKKSPKVLSHYFWAAGDSALRSTKGFLCSLLHDLLIEDDVLQQLVLKRFSSAKWKSTVQDWSNRELEAVTKYAFLASQNHWCIFIDGIDEADKEDQSTLIDLFTRVFKAPNIQLCLSSRPEPQLQHQFRDYPSLRMQDLTKPDIYKYCQDKLGTLGWKNEDEAEIFLDELYSKSSGVFLWVALVLDQLKRGTLYGENSEALSAHLRTLPNDICDLYQQMWNRANGQQIIYEEDASRYLNIAVTCGDWACFFDCWLTVTLMTLAVNPRMVTSLLYNYDNSLLKNLRTERNATKKCLVSRTAGLLEVAKDGKVAFIHRSAHDFLKFSDFGQKVLHLDKTEPMERLASLLKVYIAYMQVLLEKDRVAESSNFEMENSTDLFDKVLDNCCIFQALESVLNSINFHFPIEGNVVLADIKAVEERQLWANRCPGNAIRRALTKNGTTQWVVSGLAMKRRDFLHFVIEASFFDYASMELNRLHQHRPSGMIVSAAYENFLLASLTSGLNRPGASIGGAARLFKTLLERGINATSWNQTDSICYNTKPDHRFHIDTDLVLRFLRAVCKSDYIEDWELMARLLPGLVLAECGRIPVFIHLHSLRQTFEGVDHYEIKCLGRNPLDSHGRGIFFETNTRTLLMLLWTTAMKPSDQELASIWEEIYAAVQALAMPPLLRIVAVRSCHDEYFVPHADNASDNVLAFFGLDAISDATNSGLPTWARDQITQGRLIVIPGITDFVDKLKKTQALVSYNEVKDQLISIGRFKEEQFEVNDAPSVYSLI